MALNYTVIYIFAFEEFKVKIFNFKYDQSIDNALLYAFGDVLVSVVFIMGGMITRKIQIQSRTSIFDSEI